MALNPERDRLMEQEAGKANWRRWGPYLSERPWRTVREDYSADGDAWNYFPHDHVRSRAYRWNEDGLGGFYEDKQHLCLAVALWNEQDPMSFCRTMVSDRYRPIIAITRTFLKPGGDSSPLSMCRQNRIAVCSAVTRIGADRSGSLNYMMVRLCATLSWSDVVSPRAIWEC